MLKSIYFPDLFDRLPYSDQIQPCGSATSDSFEEVTFFVASDYVVRIREELILRLIKYQLKLEIQETLNTLTRDTFSGLDGLFCQVISTAFEPRQSTFFLIATERPGENLFDAYIKRMKF